MRVNEFIHLCGQLQTQMFRLVGRTNIVVISLEPAAFNALCSVKEIMQRSNVGLKDDKTGTPYFEIDFVRFVRGE